MKSTLVKSTTVQSSADVRTIAEHGYIYGYPLVLMDVTRQVSTNVPRMTENAAPVNQFCHMRTFPDGTFTTVVSPNVDTLYSFAFLDLRREPIVLSVPAMGERYYLMPMLDGWTNVFASPGTRTIANKKGDFAITGPGWSGVLPAGLKQIKAPTNIVWIIGRTQTNGKSGCEAVHVIQGQYKLTPLSVWGRSYIPPAGLPTNARVDMRTPPVEQVAKMDAEAFFHRLARLLRSNPPAKADAPMVKELAQMGIAPGGDFGDGERSDSFFDAVEEGVEAARRKIKEMGEHPDKPVKGWVTLPKTGVYGTDYDLRAMIACVGLGANTREDAVYPMAAMDADGHPLSGTNRYMLHFDKGKLPPVNAFWSLTMYNERHFLVSNPLQRFALGDRDELEMNPDGSLDLLIQRDAPASGRESNWLPAPAGGFILALRLYWPKADVLSGAWKPPGIKRVG